MMKITKQFFTGVAAAALCGMSAYAADLPAKAPFHKAAPVPFYNWTGFYVGVNAGIGVAQTQGSLLVGGLLDGFFFDRADAGFTGGVQVGANWQFAPQWVAGIEGDIGYLGIERSSFTLHTGHPVGIKTDGYGTIRGRLGYTTGPSLLYATGGAAFVDVTTEDTYPAAPLVSKSEVEAGWTLGGGIETMLGGNWSAKAEYLYIDAGSQDLANPNDPSLVTHFDNRFHVYKYGLNYKFGGPSLLTGALPVHNWTGFYVGGNAGVGLSQDKVMNGSFIAVSEIADSAFTGGFQLGYNWQFASQWVAGVEGEIGWLDIDRSYTVAGQKLALETDWFGTIRGRLGYSTGPALLYLTGGAAFVKVRNVFDTLPDFFAAEFASESDTASGWIVGGGIETALAQIWSVKTEYLYIDAGSQEFVNPNVFGLGPTVVHFDNRFHLFRFGLNYQFH